MRTPHRGRRLNSAVAIFVAGAAVCVASDYGFGRSDPYGSTLGVGWDLALALPFALVGVLVVFSGMSRVAAVVAALALFALVVLAFHAANTDSSSTAPVALLAPWMTGIPLVFVVWIVDAAVRRFGTWRGWSRDDRRV